MTKLEIEYEKTVEKLVNCVKNIVEESEKKGVVIGLSGGIDSVTTTYLLVKALGKEHVSTLMMPEKESSVKDLEDSIHIADTLGINYMVIDITGTVNSVLSSFGASYEKAEKKAKGNIKARVRMMFLYYYANTHDYLVAATSDRSEYLIGYFTKWGDAAGDFYPIISLYKTQVRGIAEYLGVPKEIINKPSSPGLWPGQTALGELGVNYDVIDKVLYNIVDKQLTIEETSVKTGVPVETVRRIWMLITSSEHKKRPPKTCPLGIIGRKNEVL